jgi:predicted DNA-binding transcriptional regulator YafY
VDKRTFQQFELIELVLAYEGLITNQRLREKFGISSVQASRVLASYRTAYPRNITLLTGEGRGRYAPTARFVPAVTTLSIDRYFQVANQTSKHIQMEDVRQDFTQVDPQQFRILHSAVSTESAVQILYRSMKHPEGLTRVIHPLAFVFAGRRWHVRAFDVMSSEHRDFNLARIQQVNVAQKNIQTPVDTDWEELVHLQLRPHPKLTPAQEQLIRDELFNGAAGRRVTTRRALIPYMLRELEVAENPEIQQPPDYQLYLYREE